MDELLETLQTKFPNLSFVPGKEFCWSPKTNEIFYKEHVNNQKASWSLLHETSHALLNHTAYQADFQLIRLEVDAWEKARSLAIDFNVTMDENHIQDCLDTYRDWLYRRSICPTCNTKCLQQHDYRHYRCFNCHTVWRVTPSRFCRSYRSTKNIAAKKPTAVFHLTGVL